LDSFADRLGHAIEKKASRIVVGIDPVPDKFPGFLMTEATQRFGHGRRAVAWALREFGRLVIDEVHQTAVAVKLQVAFYEQWGVPGWAALAAGIRYARQHELLVVVDAKRGDIGTTAEAYAGAFLGGTSVHGRPFPPPFPADALTVNPFLGQDALAPLVDAAIASGRGLFVLVKTSNPGSADIQDQGLAGGGTVTGAVARLVGALAAPHRGEGGYSPVGAVVGATFPGAIAELRQMLPRSYFLLPGYGAQGGSAAGLHAAFDERGLGAVVSSSRGVTYAYGQPTATPEQVRSSIARAAREFRDEVNAAMHR